MFKVKRLPFQKIELENWIQDDRVLSRKRKEIKNMRKFEMQIFREYKAIKSESFIKLDWKT